MSAGQCILAAIGGKHMELFLSHASKDNDAVALLKARAAGVGVDLYIAEHDNQAGRNLSEKVAEAIGRCDALIVLLTGDGFDSRYVHQEIGLAQGHGKLVIPLLDPALRDADLGLLNGVEYIEFDAMRPSEGLTRLTERIIALVKRAAAPEAPSRPPVKVPVRPSDSDLVVAIVGVAVLLLLIWGMEN